ncbi:MAG: hypothetical protein HYU02_02650 [Thaumarchaeota archaeon]|nr:hypothetical protein [Nitrososphaerota archaeon]
MKVEIDIPGNLHKLLDNFAILHGYEPKQFISESVIEAVTLTLQADNDSDFLIDRQRIKEVYQLRNGAEGKRRIRHGRQPGYDDKKEKRRPESRDLTHEFPPLFYFSVEILKVAFLISLYLYTIPPKQFLCGGGIFNNGARFLLLWPFGGRIGSV